MAKSIYEPKKIVRYVNNQEVIAGGLSSAPITQPARSSAPVVQSPVSTATPTPPPPPEETRAFAFDGNTQLTASFASNGGSRVHQGTLSTTISPTWAETDTGSYALFTILKSATSNDTRYTYYIQREKVGNDYFDYAGVELASGSLFSRSRQELKVSPNFYSGSRENHHIQIYQVDGQIAQVKEGHTNLKNTHTIEREYSGSFTQRVTFGRALFSNDTSIYAIGGTLNNTFSSFSGSGDHKKFEGNMRNLTFTKFDRLLLPTPVPLDTYKNKKVDLAYKFEGTVSGSRGNRDLDVMGTETFVSSSL